MEPLLPPPSGSQTVAGVAVGLGVAVGTGVGVAVGLGVAVGTGVGVAVGTGVGVAVGLGVAVGAGVGVAVGTGVGVAVGLGVAVGAGVAVALGLGVAVGNGITGVGVASTSPDGPPVGGTAGGGTTAVKDALEMIFLIEKSCSHPVSKNNDIMEVLSNAERNCILFFI